MQQNILELYDQMRQAVLGCENDVRKSAGGTRAAGVRVRKQMQEVKAMAQELRRLVLEVREDDRS